MKGVMRIIHADSMENLVEDIELTDIPDLEALQNAVGGPIQIVHFFHKTSENKNCVALCNEDGQWIGLSPNTLATRYWQRQLRLYTPNDFLVGAVVILFGDDEFEKKLVEEF